jgi:hypothetical protein
MKRAWLACLAATLVILGGSEVQPADRSEEGLVGHWKLAGDCRDYSGRGNHGVNHGVNLETGEFDGVGAYVKVPSSASLKLGAGDFALCARVYTNKDPDDVVGDVLSMYDPALRRGVTLSIASSSGGYQGQGSDRHVCFGIDNARMSQWQDCGRPSLTSNYVSNSLTVHQGKLYAAVTDAKDERDWCHVFIYEGDQKWTDCGRVGDGRTTGVGPLVVHNGELYAVTWTYDWTRVAQGPYDAGRVYRYGGGTKWIECGQPSDNRTLNCAASYRGKLYVGGGPETWGVFVREGESEWKPSKQFDKTGPQRCFPHAMSRFNGKLYVAYPAVYSFDGQEWAFAGLPGELNQNPTLQTHSLAVYQGQLCAGTWPQGKVARYLGGEQWQGFGRVGADGTEVNALVVYNGKLYGGSIPRAEVCRYDGDQQWTSLKRFYSPEGWRPGPPGKATRDEVNEWSRVTSLTVYDGQLFASMGSCTSSILDAPADVRGKVFRMEAGKCASYDDDLGPGWKHLAAIRAGATLKLYVDGKLVATSSSFDPSEYDLSTDQPLRIGFGQTDYFCGKLADIRIYNRALSEAEVQQLASAK